MGKAHLPPILKRSFSDSPISFFLGWLFNLSYHLSTLKMDPPQALTKK